MNILAVILLAIGIGLIIVGWNGTYQNVWYFLSNQQSGGTSPSGTPSPPPPPPGRMQPQGSQSGPGQKQGPTYYPALQRYQ